jgi:hypothetical protein
MNNVRYSKQFDVFVCDKNEQVQASNMDMMAHRRVIAGFVVFRMLFGWRSIKNPLYKIMVEEIANYPEDIIQNAKKRSEEIIKVITPLIDQITLATMRIEYSDGIEVRMECEKVIDFCMKEINKVLKPQP